MAFARIARALLAFSALALCVHAHSFLSVPTPISLVETCRLGGAAGFVAHCQGPCPNYDFREDMPPEAPSVTYKRGERVEIRWTKNNHFDGFMRLALVPIGDMWDKQKHEQYAFYFGCWSDNEVHCNEKERHRDCYYDRDNIGYKTEVTIPTIYPNGVYVLGFTWYGGGRGFGSFADYWDCAYIEINGGPDPEESYPAAFETWDGSCKSAADRMGECLWEPCTGHRWSTNMIPREFQNGPPNLYRGWFEDAMSHHSNQIAVARHSDFGVTGFQLIDSHTEQEMVEDISKVIWIEEWRKISLVPVIHGHVDFVRWFINGKQLSDQREFPFAIAGQQPAGDGYNYYDLGHPIFDRRLYVTAQAFNGDRWTWHSEDLTFMKV